MNYTIYCDGSCRNNGGVNAVGAWGYIFINESTDSIAREECGVCKNTTNQRMELTACLNALNSLKLYDGDTVRLYTDSAYLHNCVSAQWYANWCKNGWVNAKKQPVANQDLWQQLLKYFNNNNIKFYKATAHKNDKWNNYVDNMVQSASLKASKENNL